MNKFSFKTSKLAVDPLGGKHEARWRERKKRNLDKESNKQKHDIRKVGMEERKWLSEKRTVRKKARKQEN